MSDDVKCDLCGGNPDECGCENCLVQHMNFEGGPLDGCSLKIPGSQFALDLLVGVPAKMEGDSEAAWTGQTLHRYTCCNSTRLEGSKDVENYMGHVGTAKVSLEQMNEMFQVVLSEENKQWVADIEQIVERKIEAEERGFDINNDDETDEEREEDGEGWKHI